MDKSYQTSKMTKYYDIRPELKTGDVIFFYGADAVSSTICKIERIVCNNHQGEWSHIGMVIMSTSFPIGHPYRLCGVGSGYDYAVIPYIFELTQSGLLTDGVLNVDGFSFLGVQLRRLDDVADKYNKLPNTRMAWGRLTVPIGVTQDQMLKTIRGYDGIRYDLNFLDLFACAYKKLRWIRNLVKYFCCKSVDSWQFCSELVANLYIEFGILSPNINPENVLPCDFLPEQSLPVIGRVLFDIVVPFTTY